LADQEAAFGSSGSGKGLEEERTAWGVCEKPVENSKESGDNLILLSFGVLKKSFVQIDLRGNCKVDFSLGKIPARA